MYTKKKLVIDKMIFLWYKGKKWRDLILQFFSNIANLPSQSSNINTYQGVGSMAGSVQKDKKSGRYYISVYWSGRHHKIWQNPANGEKFYAKQQAQRCLTSVRHEIDQGIFNPRHWMPQSPLIINNYYQLWLDNINVSKKTWTDYRGYFRNHICPRIGDMDIRHIRKMHITKLYNDLQLSDKGKYNVINTLKTMLKFAYDNEDLPRVPPFPRLSFELPEIEYLTLEQQQTVLSYIPADDRPIFEFGMEYGLRTQEVRALCKDCIADDSIIIKRSFAQNTLQEHTKTKHNRALPLTNNAIKIIKSARPTTSDFVFVRKDGKPYTSKNLNTIWRRACNQAGINIKLQAAFRHSLGSQLLDNGADLEMVRDILGHTRSDMTRRYAKRNPVTMQAALEKRSKVISFPRSESVPKAENNS
jgi:integrase